MADRLGVRLLGDFSLDGVDLAGLRSRQARTLLKRLALARGAKVDADSLVAAVWPHARPALPDRDLHVLVSRARALVGTDRIVHSDGGYALRADWWDVVELESLARAAMHRVDSGDHAGARTAAEAALTLARGPLLADDPDAAWTDAARAAATGWVAEVRRVAAVAALATGQVGSAATHAAEGLRHDPYDERALRTLMRAQVASGRPASALGEFARFREQLADELGVDPSSETLALHQELLRDEPAAPPPSPSAVALVGRGDQLAALGDELGRSARGVRVVLVTGEPGAGKSALLEAWSTVATRTGVLVLRGRAREGDLALQAVLDALAGSLTAVTDLLGAGHGAGLPGPGATSDALNLRVFEHLDEVFRSLASQRRVVLVIDDADDLDPVTWAWLAHLRRRHEPLLLVVVALREAARSGVTAEGVVEVPPLGLVEARELVGPDRAEDIWRRSEGNALLLTELARAGADLDADLNELPGSVREAVSARLRRAGDATVTIQTAAVLDARIDLDLLTAVLGAGPLDVLAHLDTAVRHAFLAERDGSLGFRHELVRVAIAAEAGSARRAWIHRRAAEVLSDRPDASVLELARHARAGGDASLAARCLAEASEQALSRLDLAGAEQLLDDAIVLHDEPAHRLRRSRVRMSRGDLDGADADAGHAMSSDTTGEALELRAWAARNRHDLDGAIRLGRAAADAASDATIRASSLIAVAFGHRGQGDLRQAESVLEEAVDAPAELGLPAWAGVLRVHQGRPTEALATLEPILGAEARRGTQGFWVEHTLQMTAHAYGLLGRSTDALQVLDGLERELERRGTDVRYAGVQHTYRSWILRNLGDPSAVDVALEGLAMAGSQEILAQCHLDVADCLVRVGDLAGAAERLVVAEAESGTRRFHNKWRFDQRRLLLLARLALTERDAGAALETVEPVITGAEHRGDERYAVLGRLVRAAALAAHGRSYDEARLATDLDALAHVAALEGWWLAAGVADATGSAHARETASRLAEHVAREAGARAPTFRSVAAARLG